MILNHGESQTLDFPLLKMCVNTFSSHAAIYRTITIKDKMLHLISKNPLAHLHEKTIMGKRMSMSLQGPFVIGCTRGITVTR